MRGWAQGISDNVVANLIASAVVAGLAIAYAWFHRWPWKDIALVGLGVAFVALLTVTLLAIRASRRGDETVRQVVRDELRGLLPMLEERMTAVLASHRDSPSGRPHDKRVLGENELIHEGMLWTWNGHEAQGPRCLTHGESFALKAVNGDRVLYQNFEEGYLGNSGCFVCPEDNAEIIRIPAHLKVKTLRWQVGERFRSRFHLAAMEEPLTPQEREQKRLAKENAERLFKSRGLLKPPLPASGETKDDKESAA